MRLIALLFATGNSAPRWHTKTLSTKHSLLSLYKLEWWQVPEREWCLLTWELCNKQRTTVTVMNLLINLAKSTSSARSAAQSSRSCDCSSLYRVTDALWVCEAMLSMSRTLSSSSSSNIPIFASISSTSSIRLLFCWRSILVYLTSSPTALASTVALVSLGRSARPKSTSLKAWSRKMPVTVVAKPGDIDWV